MRATIGKTSLLVSAVLGCGSSEPPTSNFTPPVAPPLETVNYSLLGSGKLAFHRIGPLTDTYSAVYVIDASGMSSSMIPGSELWFGPALSPDGGRVAYTDDVFGTTGLDVFVSNLQGAGTRRVTQWSGHEGPPTWTPDGARIISTGGDNAFIDQIYSVSPVQNATDRTALTNWTLPPTGQEFRCPVVVDPETRVVASPQGLLAFACVFGEVNVLSASGVLFATYRPDRTNRQQWPNMFSASWSPDGARVAFIETISDADLGLRIHAINLKVMNADGTNVQTIVTVSTAGSNAGVGGGWIGPNNLSLCWMPDGSRLVFTVPQSEMSRHLWVVRADGTGLAQLTTAPGVWDRSVSCSGS